MATRRPNGGRGSNQYQSKGSSSATPTSAQASQRANLAAAVAADDAPWSNGPTRSEARARSAAQPRAEGWAGGLVNPTLGPGAAGAPLPTYGSSPGYRSAPTGAVAQAAAAVDQQRNGLASAIETAETNPTTETMQQLDAQIGSLRTARSELLDQRSQQPASSRHVDTHLELSRVTLRRAERVRRSLQAESRQLSMA